MLNISYHIVGLIANSVLYISELSFNGGLIKSYHLPKTDLMQ